MKKAGQNYVNFPMRNRILAAAIAIAIIPSLFGQSTTNWEIKGSNKVTQLQMSELINRYPKIESFEQARQLLKDLTRLIPTNQADVIYENDRYFFNISEANIVSTIDINLVSRRLKSYLQTHMVKHLAKPNSFRLQTNVKSDIKSRLAYRGFRKATVNLVTSNPEPGQTAYTIEIDEKTPCVISNIEYRHPHPIFNKLEIKSGDLCDEQEINNAITEFEKILEDSGYIGSRINDYKLDYNENNISANLIIDIQIGSRIIYKTKYENPNYNLSEFFTQDLVLPSDPESIDPESMVEEIRKRLVENGLLDSTVKGPEVNKTSNETTYTYLVEPGRQYTLTSIKFDGLRHFSEQEAIEIMEIESFWSNTIIYNPSEIDEGLAALKSKYQEEAFWDVIISGPIISKNKTNNTIDVLITVVEGKKRLFDKLTIIGNNEISSQEIQDLLPLKNFDPINQNDLLEFNEKLKSLYYKEGYIYSTQTLKIKSHSHLGIILVNPVIEIVEETRAKFGLINVVGLIKTESKIVYREISFQSGDNYLVDKIIQSKRNLIRLGLFRSIQIYPSDSQQVAEKSPVINITVELIESDAGNIQFGPGYSWPEGIHYEGEISYSNLLGQAKRVGLKVGISEQRHQIAISNKTFVGRKAGISYLSPYVYDIPIDFYSSLSHIAKISDQNYALWQLTWSGEIGFSYLFRDLTPNSHISIFYGQNLIKEEGINEDKIYLVSTGDSRIGYLGSRYDFDSRDSSSWPTKGIYFDFEYKYARRWLNGNIKYNKWMYQFSFFKALSDSFVLSLGQSLGQYSDIEWIGDFPNILPTSERFLAGGMGTVRGFRRAELGPYIEHPQVEDGIDLINLDKERKITGGSMLSLYKIELRYRIDELFGLSFFYDSGNVFLSDQEESEYDRYFRSVHRSRLPDDAQNVGLARLKENKKFKASDIFSSPNRVYEKHYSAIGPALSVITPIGSMNFACGTPVNLVSTDECDPKNNLGACKVRGAERSPWYYRLTCGFEIGGRF